MAPLPWDVWPFLGGIHQKFLGITTKRVYLVLSPDARCMFLLSSWSGIAHQGDSLRGGLYHPERDRGLEKSYHLINNIIITLLFCISFRRRAYTKLSTFPFPEKTFYYLLFFIESAYHFCLLAMCSNDPYLFMIFWLPPCLGSSLDIKLHMKGRWYEL